MKKDEVLEKMNLIDDEYITEAANTPKKKSRLPAIISAAAAVLVLGAVGFGVNGILKSRTGKYPSYPTVYYTQGGAEETNPDMYTEEDWEKMPLCSKFREFTFNGMIYEAREGQNVGDYVDAYLGEVTVTGQNYMTGETQEIHASLYGLKKVKPEAALVIQYEGSDEYFTAIAPYYQPDTLQDFIQALNLGEYMEVDGGTYCSEKDESGIWHQLLMEGMTQDLFSGSVITPYLESRCEEGAYDTMNSFRLSTAVSAPVYGIYNASFWISDNGYIVTNLTQTGKYFYIGEEAAQKILQDMKDQLTIGELVMPASEGQNGSGVSTSEEVVPEYGEETTENYTEEQK